MSEKLYENDLMQLAQALKSEIDAQPDGEARTIPVTVGSDNKGTVIVGSSHVTINPERQGPRTWADCTDDELHQARANWRAAYWSAWRGYWFNLPSGLILGVLVGLGAITLEGVNALVNGQPSLIDSLEYSVKMMTIVGAGCVVIGLGAWLKARRRAERGLMNKAQGKIDAIDVELRQRR